MSISVFDFSKLSQVPNLEYLSQNQNKITILQPLFHLPTQNLGAITKFKKSVGWTIDRFLLDISLVINEGILTFSY